MADHADDTILDDELDENEYNFDNENEDDLLADNDDWLEKSKSTTAEITINHVTKIQGLDEDKIIEQSEAEEDVLDIGLVDEDVDPELQDSGLIYSQVKSEPVKRLPEKATETRESAVSKNKHEPLAEDHQQIHENSPKEIVPSSNIDNIAAAPNKNSFPSHEDDQDDDEKTAKAKVISLKKSVKKSYDDLPELAKVIPGSSRNAKVQRSNDTHTSRKEASARHPYEYDDRRKHESTRLGRERDRDRDRDRDHDWERDRSRDRSRERYRDRSYDRDRSRDRDRDYNRSPNYRDKYYSSDDDRSPSPFRGSLDRHADALAHSYQKPEPHFQNVTNQYPPPGVQMAQVAQDRYNFQGMRPNMPPQPQNQMHPPNHFGPPNLAFNRPPPPQMEHMMRQPPPGNPRMPPQPMGFQQESRMQPPPHQPGFRPPPPQMNQRFPPNLPPHMQPRGPPMHGQPMPFNGPSQPQMPHQRMMQQPGPSPQMQPHFPPPGSHLRPPQPICGPMEHMRQRPPLPLNMRPPMMRLPGPNEHQQPAPVMGHAPQRPMSHPNNFPPPNNGVRMAPPFRPPHHVPPPQNIAQRPPPYFNEQPQFHGGALPGAQYPQGPRHMNQAPPYAGGVPGQPVQPAPVNNRPVGEGYPNAPNRPEANYSQYPQQNYAQQSARQYPEYPQYGTGNSQNQPQKRVSSLPNDSPAKYGRYDEISGKRESDDDDMKSYREKVEHQKRIREKYIQEKEEQRLKNQMQSFIQNNIKGILEKREQLIRKNEFEQSKPLREMPKETSRIADSKRSDESRRNDNSDYRSRRSVSPVRKNIETLRRSVSPIRRNVEAVRRSISPVRRNVEVARRSFSPVRKNVEVTRIRDRDRVRDVVSKERPKIVSGRSEDGHRSSRTERRDKHEDSMSESERKQLHKVSRITYKDGTVALKCIPVRNNNSFASKSSVSSSRKNDEDSNSSGANRRRMVVSQQIPVANVKHELNENLIVESIRMGVTQSSMTLAKRFSNLKVMNKNTEEDDSLSTAKSKKQLIVPDEDGTRTVFVKNVPASTSPAVVQKMISSCGTVSRTNWMYNGGRSPNHVKITFCREEDAKKFCQTFHKKTIDSSTITVSLVADLR